MAGTLVKTTDGLIFAHGFENALVDWSTEVSGSTTATADAIPYGGLAHGGSKALRFKIGGRLPSWPNSAYVRAYKTVDVKTGASRVIRIYRSPVHRSYVGDDFWDETGIFYYVGGSHSLANSICTLQPNTNLTMQGYDLPQQYAKFKIRFKVNAYADFVVAAWYQGGGCYVGLLRFKADGTYQIETYGDYLLTATCGSYDLNTYHDYEISWIAGHVTLYVDGNGKAANDSAFVPAPTYATWQTYILGNTPTLYIDYIGYTANSTPSAKVKVAVGAQTIYDMNPGDESYSSTPDNGYFDDTAPWTVLTQTGSQIIDIRMYNSAGFAYPFNCFQQFDDILIMLTKLITVSALLGGQKVELYNAGGGLLWTYTCPAPGSSGTYDVSALITTVTGFLGYFKVYDTNGTTLLYTSSTIAIWGGDIYTWTPNETKAEITTNVTLVYRTGSGDTPTTATVTVTLKNKATDAVIPGKTIYFVGNKGSVNPANAQTDAYGQASTTFTAGATCGLGGVKGTFNGDATYSGCSILQLIDVYYAHLTPDATKDFQVWIEGQEIICDSGNYKIATDFKAQAFSVTTPLLSVTIGGWWAIEIYRRGALEFSGRILHRRVRTGSNPQLSMTGLDEKVILQRRVANKSYLDEPKNIILDLLTRYPCGVAAGTIALYGTNIKLDAVYENLFDALMQIAKTTGWLFRLNANRTLDFGSTFGATQGVTVQVGTNAQESTFDEDWTQLDTTIFVIGAGQLVSTATDATGMETYGLIEDVFLEKSVTQQGTLDLVAQDKMSQHSGSKIMISTSFIDTYDTGAYKPWDSVTVTDNEAGLSGLYVVKTIARNLLDANLATLELSNRYDLLADTFQNIRQVVKDLGVA